MTPDEGRGRGFLVFACAGSVVLLLGLQALTPALPAMQQHFGLSASEIGHFTSVYLLPGVFLTLPLGLLVDALGRRRLFVGGLALFGLTGPAVLLVEQYELVLAIRFVQGIGFAAVMPLTMTIIGDAFRGREQIRAQSVRVFALTAGNLALPLLGGVLAALTWRIPVALQSLALPVALAGLFLLDDRRTGLGRRQYAREMVTVLRRAGMPGALTAGFGRFMFKFAVLTYVPVLAVSELGLSVATGGAIVALTAGTGAIASLQTARLTQWMAPSRLLTASMVGVALGLVGIGTATGLWWAVAAAAWYGLADGVLVALQSSYIVRAAPADVRAGVVAASGALRNFGKFLAPAAISVVALITTVGAAFVLMGAVAVVLACFTPSLRHLDRVLLDDDAPAEPAGAPDRTSAGRDRDGKEPR